MSVELPYVDEHSIEISAPKAVVWDALEAHASTALRFGPHNPLATILGTEPREGFEVGERDAGHMLTLVGRHRFARYRLTFLLDDTVGGGTELSARTYAAFSGVHGWLYRMLVIGSRGHTVAVRRILRAIGRRSVRLARR